MYIEEIILDGFKSYANRTTIRGFDSEFNAITGMNGSGKSNILDAICFVLGISNLSQVRAGNLQELVYKQGQAGITKASVTICFNNTDQDRSPIGYEQCDQISVTRTVVIGGRNKYLINGRVAQQSQVQNLFHSVQLNVNNPHFLIMQGRITKVLNMKPPEILSMIEEAAGTRMYEVKKEASIKTMEKKQRKLDEINEILETEIKPKLENLKQQRQQYLQWTSDQTELERLEKFCIAAEYASFKTKQDVAYESCIAIRLEIQDFEARLADIQDDIARLDGEMKEVSSRRDMEITGELQTFENEFTRLQNEVVKATTALENEKEAHFTEEKNLHELISTSGELKNNVNSNKLRLEEVQQELGEKRERKSKIESQITALRNQYESVSAGVAGGDGGMTLTETLMDLESQVAQHQAEIRQGEMRIDHIEAELKKLSKNATAARKELGSMEKERDHLIRKLDEVNSQIESYSYSPADYEDLQRRKRREEMPLDDLRKRVKDLDRSLSSFSFDYDSPYNGFDRSQVQGVVAKLFNVEDPSATYALQIAAGSRLLNVVVSNADVGKDLLQKGNLKKRITIIPLDKIQPSVISSETVSRAQSLVGEENTHVALELIGYEESVRKAMEFVFGNTMICTDMDVAKSITFEKSIRVKSVTLDGEMFDPRGTLSGGSMDRSRDYLSELQHLSLAEHELRVQEGKVKSIENEIQTILERRARFEDLMRQKELSLSQLELCEERLQSSRHYKVLEEVRNLEEELQSCKSRVSECTMLVRTCLDRRAQLESDSKNVSSVRDKKLSEISSSLSLLKNELEETIQSIRDLTTQVEKLQVEIDQSLEEISLMEERTSSSREEMEGLKKRWVQIEEELAHRQSQCDAARRDLDTRSRALHQFSSRLETLETTKEKLLQEISDLEIRRKKQSHTLSKCERDATEAEAVVSRLTREHKWISSEERFFGTPGSEYDFSTRNPARERKRLKEIVENSERLKNSINKKVLTLFETAEQEYEDLMEKKSRVEEDKEKIEAAISELDEKKREVLLATYEKVNRDFGSIFSTLLPGTFARLDPIEGCELFDGLEVRVKFGETWKESLTELSGGQKSLLALSLILALLLFKPAPVYILDEVDSALDLSHTQNIGRMLKEHFTHSQFIVVSLKEGMFNNANVIFRTKFVNGQSTVTRISNVDAES